MKPDQNYYIEHPVYGWLPRVTWLTYVYQREKMSKLQPTTVWRNSDELKELREKITKEISLMNTGIHVMVTFSTMRAILEVINQAIHTEEGHGT